MANSVSENKELCRKMWLSLNKGSMAEWKEYCAPGFVNHDIFAETLLLKQFPRLNQLLRLNK